MFFLLSPSSHTSSVESMYSRENGESTVALWVRRLAIRAPEVNCYWVNSGWRVGHPPIPPAIDSEDSNSNHIYTPIQEHVPQFSPAVCGYIRGGAF